MSEIVYRVDHDDQTGVTTRWLCPPPPSNLPFRVLDEEWNADHTERTIKAIEKATPL